MSDSYQYIPVTDVR